MPVESIGSDPAITSVTDRGGPQRPAPDAQQDPTVQNTAPANNTQPPENQQPAQQAANTSAPPTDVDASLRQERSEIYRATQPAPALADQGTAAQAYSNAAAGNDMAQQPPLSARPMNLDVFA